MDLKPIDDVLKSYRRRISRLEEEKKELIAELELKENEED
jgi:uncharacterized protein (UPF0335 family)